MNAHDAAPDASTKTEHTREDMLLVQPISPVFWTTIEANFANIPNLR